VLAQRIAGRLPALALAIGLVACTATVRPGSIASTSRIRADGLCESIYTIVRQPTGPWDRVGVHRLARCGSRDADAPVLLYLPGMHMNGELRDDATTADVRRDLARAGVRVWSVDYRTHAVPADASDEELHALAGWTADLFADDADMVGTLARAFDRGPYFVAGFSYGAGLAYRLAARDHPMDGLVILDGMPPDGRGPERRDEAIDVGGSRLPYPERRVLLDAVLTDASGPSPVEGFATAGDALADRIYTARSFGGRGGLSAAKTGVTDVRSLAALLASYDRWWPGAALGGPPVTPRRVRVLAFASTTIGPEWTARVRDGAVAFGGPDAIVHELPGYGHVDVLIGRDVARLVAEPVRAFVGASG
jgi:pimeloyl-ACP methyl ester carboxylesterase